MRLIIQRQLLLLLGAIPKQVGVGEVCIRAAESAVVVVDEFVGEYVGVELVGDVVERR